MSKWDLFYKRNTVNFFKDRHWLEREFPELVPAACGAGAGASGSVPAEPPRPPSQPLVVLEVGCGVGNTVFPLLQKHAAGLFVHCCDFSKRAVEFVQSNVQYDTERCHAFQCDLTADELTRDVRPPHVAARARALWTRCFYT